MFSFTKELVQSLRLLRSHIGIVVPLLLQVLITIFIIIMLLTFTGLSEPILKYFEIQKEYKSQKESFLKGEITLFEFRSLEDIEAENAFDAEYFLGYFTLENIFLLLFFLLLEFFVNLYLTSMSFSIISHDIRRQKKTVSALISETNRIFPKLFGYWIILYLVLTIPTYIGSFIVYLAMVVPLIALFLYIFFALLFIFYWIFITIRFYFTVPAMYLNSSGVLGGISLSSSLTRIHTMRIVGILLFFGIINIIFGLLSGPHQENLFLSLFAGQGSMLLSLAVFILYVVVEVLIVSFESIFLFYSFKDTL